jgi:hypothetical protein
VVFGDVVTRLGKGAVVVVLIGTACGDPSPAIPLDPLPDTTPESTSLAAADGSSSSTTEPPDQHGADGAGETDEADVGREWTDVTANLEGTESYCGNLAFVSAHPVRDQVYAGVAGQGLFVSGPDSPEWQPFGRGELSAPLDHRTTSIIYDPDNPDRFWESGFFGLGPPPNPQASDINRTDDGGQTFVRLGEPVPSDLVSVDFTDPERRTMLAGGHGRPEVHRSIDGGQTWENISSGLPGGAMGEASYPHVIDAGTYLVGAHKGSASGIFRTTDGGASWTRVFARAVSGPPLRSGDGNLYWVVEEGGIVASSDDGETWEPLENRAPAGGERRGRIVELGDGTWITMGVEHVIVSGDRGVTWQAVGPPFPYQPDGFTYSAVRGAVYAWQNYCDFETGVNPVLPGSIIRLDLVLDS